MMTPRLNLFGQVRAFFNFVRETSDHSFTNPFDSPALRKLFRNSSLPKRDALQKEVMDEMIFRTEDVRSRPILELMARGACESAKS